jgi:hypothetical protein
MEATVLTDIETIEKKVTVGVNLQLTLAEVQFLHWLTGHCNGFVKENPYRTLNSIMNVEGIPKAKVDGGISVIQLTDTSWHVPRG